MHNLIDRADKLLLYLKETKKENQKSLLSSDHLLNEPWNDYANGWSMGEMNPAMLLGLGEREREKAIDSSQAWKFSVQ